jgi:hypothetical protein
MAKLQTETVFKATLLLQAAAKLGAEYEAEGKPAEAKAVRDNIGALPFASLARLYNILTEA